MTYPTKKLKEKNDMDEEEVIPQEKKMSRF